MSSRHRGSFSCPCLLAATVGAQRSVEERVARVERGLLPRVVAQGRIGQRFSITDRMTYHGIPA
jgi:hypothetical protein